MNLKQIFCRHNFVDKCKIDKYRHAIKAANLETSWQELCLSRVKNKSCRKHDEKYNLLEGYCDYYYQECIKCGKVKNDFKLRKNKKYDIRGNGRVF